MRKWIVIAIVVLLIAAAAYLAPLYLRAGGVFTSLEPRLVETCQRMDVHPGTEDVTFDPASGLAFVSASDRRAIAAGQSVTDGIWVVDPDAPRRTRRVSNDAPEDFHPHGIDLWTGADGTSRLFAVSHRLDGTHVVEVFDVSDDLQLSHAETVRFDALISPNDLVAVGPDQFYVTNDHGHVGGLLGAAETWLALPWASVAYYDGEAGEIIADGLRYANGINVSADGGTVYVARLLDRDVVAYARDRDTGALTQTRRYPVATAPDNIEVAEDGSLWIGAHPNVFAFLAHANDPDAVSPSQGVRLDPETGEIETVFVSLDGEISASSVAAVRDGRLLVGAVFDRYVMSCDLEG